MEIDLEFPLGRRLRRNPHKCITGHADNSRVDPSVAARTIITKGERDVLSLGYYAL